MRFLMLIKKSFSRFPTVNGNENFCQKMVHLVLNNGMVKFYQIQRLHFQELFKDEQISSDSLLGYLDELFDYLKQNSNLKNLKYAEENY